MRYIPLFWYITLHWNYQKNTNRPNRVGLRSKWRLSIDYNQFLLTEFESTYCTVRILRWRFINGHLICNSLLDYWLIWTKLKSSRMNYFNFHLLIRRLITLRGITLKFAALRYIINTFILPVEYQYKYIKNYVNRFLDS